MKYITSINAFLVEEGDLQDGVLYINKIAASNEEPRFIATDDVLAKCKKVVFGDEVDVIPTDAFYLWHLEDVVLGKNTCFVGKNAFWGNNLKKLNTASIVRISDEAFASNEQLKEIYLGENLSRLGTGVFKNNSSLKKVVIEPKNKFLTTIPAHCFEGDKQLEKVENLNYRLYEAHAFDGCSKLKITLSQHAFMNIHHYGPNDYITKRVFGAGAEITVLVDDYNTTLREAVKQMKEFGVAVSAIPATKKAANQLAKLSQAPEETELIKAKRRLNKINAEIPKLNEEIFNLQVKVNNLPSESTEPVVVGKSTIRL